MIHHFQERKACFSKLLFLPLILMLLTLGCLPAMADDDTPTLNDSSYYEISTAAQLKWFATKVNAGDQSINAVLTADIDVSTLGEEYWTPIGVWTEASQVQYKGKFNGQNHTVSGIVLRKAAASGLFGMTQGATISNVIVKGAQMKASSDDKMDNFQYGIAPICGVATGGTLIQNCHSQLTDILYVISQYKTCMEINCVGGIVGELRSSTAKDCTANGFVRTDGIYVGGIVGALNCGLVENCHFLAYDNGNSAVVGKDFVGGIAGYLQGRSRVNAIVNCTVAHQTTISATAISDINARRDSVCGGDTLLAEPSEFNGSYEINTTDQLKWFASKVNGGTTKINARLMNDLNMSQAGLFTPIGTTDYPFAGEFDGQEFTIDSLTIASQDYAGLFGYVKDGRVRNVTLTHASLDAGNNDYQGLIVGWLTQNPGNSTCMSYVENCHVREGNLYRGSSSGEPQYVGGIVGKVDMSAEVRNCSFRGSVKAHEDYIGGIAGCMDSGAKMYECTTIGPSTVWGDDYVGGVVGYMTDTDTKIENCYADQSEGQITIHAEGSGYSGLIRGYDKSGSSSSTTYSEGNLLYRVTGKKITVDGKQASETHITGVSSQGKGTYYAIVDIGSSYDYFTTKIESMSGVETLYFLDNNSSAIGTTACGWINMTIDDYAFDSNFKALKMYYHMRAGGNNAHDVMLRPSDVRPAGEKMFANCPDAKVYVEAEYYDEFCNDSLWGKYKNYIVPVTFMRTEDVNAEYGARYALDRNSDKTGSPVTVANGTTFGVYQAHIIGIDDSYVNGSGNDNTLWIYQDIGQTYDYNTTKVWTKAFKDKSNIKKVKFQSITKSARRPSQAFHIELGDSAFANCKNLESFNIALYSDEGNDHVEFLYPEDLPLGKGVFDGCDNMKIFVPRDLVSAFKNDTVYGWSQYKSLITEGDFGANNFTERGVIYSYYTSADGQTRYNSGNNDVMESVLAPMTPYFRNFTPSKVLVYDQSDKVKYVMASGVNPDKINSEGGVMCLYNDIGETHPNHYKTLALSGNGFQNQTCIKRITFEDIKSNNYNVIADLSFIIPDYTFKGCSNLKELSMFMLDTRGSNKYVAIKPSQVFIGEHVFDSVSDDFRISVLPSLYYEYLNDPNWSQYKDYIVAASYLPTDATAKVRNGVTYDFATKVMNGKSAKQVTALTTSWWTALVIGVEVALTIATWGTSSAAPNPTVATAVITPTMEALEDATESIITTPIRKAFEEIAQYGVSFMDDLMEYGISQEAAIKMVKDAGAHVIGNGFYKTSTWLCGILENAIIPLTGAAYVSGPIVGHVQDKNTAINYIANRVKKNYNRRATWSMTGGGYVVNTEQITNVPHMYVKDVEDRDVAIIYNDCGDGNGDYQTVAVAFDAFHNKKLLKEVKFQERYGDGTRSIAGGLSLALPDSMFCGCTNLELLNLVLYSTGAESGNHCYKALTPDNFVPLGDIFAGMDSTARSKVRIKVGEEALQEFLDDEYWAQYKDMFITEGISIVKKQTEWSCKYALAYDKNTLPLRTTSGTHNIDHVYVYAGDDGQLDQNDGLAALINDFGEWNNYKLDYVKDGAFKGNNKLRILDMTDTHTNVADVYDSDFNIALQDSAFAHCHEFEDLNLIYQVTDETNHCESIKPEQVTLGFGVFDDTPKLRIKFCLDQEDAFLADTAWVKYKDKFAPCLFKPADSKVGDILLHPYRFMTKLNDGTNFDYVDASRPKPEDLKDLFKGKKIGTFDEFRTFSACGLRTVYNGMFANCTYLQHILLPDSTETIETNAFQNCSLLAQLTIPDKVTSIQENAFTGSAIKEFFVKSAVPADIDPAKAFAGLDSTYIIYVNDSVVDTYRTKWVAVAGHINAKSKYRGLKVVHLKEPGTLAQALGLEYKYSSSVFADNHLYGNYAQFDSLRIIGPIDGRDIGVIRFMGGRDVDDNNPTPGHLKYLDLYEADIKAAGKYEYNRACYKRDYWSSEWFPWVNNYINNDNEISHYMFWCLNSLETVILPRSATRIQTAAFDQCTNLKMLVIGDNMADISTEWLEYYVMLGTPNKTVLVMLGNNVPETDDKSFYPASGYHYGFGSVRDFGADNSRFSLCIAPYKAVKDYAASVGYSSTCDSIIGNFEDPALVEALKAKHVFSLIDLMGTSDIKGYVNGNTTIKTFNELLASSVTTLGDSTLTDMQGLESVGLPLGLKTITADAFKKCQSLRTIKAFGTEPPTLAEHAFVNLPTDFVIYVLEGYEDTYRKAWPEYKNHIQGYRSERGDVREITLEKPNTLADSLNATIRMDGNMVVGVGGDLASLTSLKVSGPIGGQDLALIRYLGGREPDWNEHVYVTNLKYLDLYDAELRADNYEFMLKGKNRRIEKDNEIPKDMLWNCDNLETVILPRTATKLSYEACYDMASLKTLVIGDDVTYIDDDALGDNRKLEKILFLCKSKPGIDGDAFTDPLEGANRKVGKMYVRKSLVEAFSADAEYTGHTSELTQGFDDDELFSAFGCKALATEDDLASVNNVDGWFKNFPKITNLKQLSRTKITSLRSDEFDNLKGLQYTTLPSTLTSIGKDAFKENAALRWADLSACDSLSLSTDTLGVCANALVYLPETAAETQSPNVIYGKKSALQCAEFYLTDSHGYDVPKAFTAKKVTFGREFANNAYTTLTLPFDMEKSPEGFEFYALDTDSTRDGTIFFKKTTGSIAANTPYAVRANEPTLVVDAETSIPATVYRGNMVKAGDYALYGNLQDIDATTAISSKFLLFSDSTNLWNVATSTTDSLCPFSAYAQRLNTVAAADGVQSRFLNGLFHYYIGTVQHDIEGDGTEDAPFYADKLELVDGLDFMTEKPFRADTAIYARTMNNTWGTLCLPYAIDASVDNATCYFYTVSENTGDNLSLTRLHDVIPAGTPILVQRRKAGTDVVISVENEDVVTEPLADATGQMSGSFQEMEVTDDNAYIIANDHFWNVGYLKTNQGAKTVKIKGFRTYVLSGDGESKLNISVDDDATVVDRLNSLTDSADTRYYDAQGRQTNGLQRGLNIVRNGKRVVKVMIK